MLKQTRGERIQGLLTEYAAAQNSAQHHDSLAWTVIGIIWGAELVLLGFIIQASIQSNFSLIILFSSILALVLIVYLFISYLQFKYVLRSKYARCREIEAILGLRQHVKLNFRKNVGTISFFVVNSFFCWFGL